MPDRRSVTLRKMGGIFFFDRLSQFVKKQNKIKKSLTAYNAPI
jgi:hypothetical protein